MIVMIVMMYHIVIIMTYDCHDCHDVTHRDHHDNKKYQFKMRVVKNIVFLIKCVCVWDIKFLDDF